MPNIEQKFMPNNSQSDIFSECEDDRTCDRIFLASLLCDWKIILRDFLGAILRPLVTPYRRWNSNPRV
jgi:hypothetical protein